MDSKFQTSFIPKDSLNNGSVKIKTPINLLFVSGVIIMLFTIGISSGVFFYQRLIQSHIDTKKELLNQKQQSIDSASIDQVVQVDNKLKIAANLLNSHTAVSGLFKLLQGSTLKNLRFTDFAFNYVSANKVTISMKGQATGFEVVARQAEAFASSTITGNNFKDPIFSDLGLDDKGNVSFSFLTSIDPKVILYSTSFSPIPTPTTKPSSVVPVATSTASSTQATTTNIKTQ